MNVYCLFKFYTVGSISQYGTLSESRASALLENVIYYWILNYH